MDLTRELAVRETMFAVLDALTTASPDGNLRWDQTGRFDVAGEEFVMRQVHGKGIHKPRRLDAALSITTTFAGYMGRGKYDDEVGADGYQRYKYEGTDPNLATNRSLRVAMDAALSLAYFVGVAPHVYQPVYPAYVIAESPNRHEFAIGFRQSEVGLDLGRLPEIERRYALRMTRQRLHQPRFREVVLHAYADACAVCRIRHRDLLDAAHIIEDSQEGGEPTIDNGMSLCKIHHAAYDRSLLGVSPDYRVHINAELLAEVDGPMLQHGLKEMHGTLLTRPRRRSDWPDADKLATRFERFQKVA